MGQNRCDFSDLIEKRRTCFVEDDFNVYVDANLWTKTLTGAATAPTVTNPDAQSGVISLGNGSTNANSSAIVATTRKMWTFAASRPMYAAAEIQYAEANTNQAGIFFGFGSAIGATFLADTTGAPVVTGSAVGIYKLPGELVWRAMLNVNGVQVLSGLTLESTQPSPTATFQKLAIQVDVVGSGLEATFYTGQRDGPGSDATVPVGLQQFREASSGFGKAVKLRMAFASAAAMQFAVILKQFSATSETLVVDLMSASSLRT